MPPNAPAGRHPLQVEYRGRGRGGEEDEAGVHEPPDPLEEIEEAADELESLRETERESIIRARVGQGVFRKLLVEAWDGCCAVTGADFLPALVASQIKRWADCTNEDRINAANGLLLVGTLDRLFDSGFITFAVDGAIRISSSIPEDDYAALGLAKELRLQRVPTESLPFLDVHRRDYFVEDDAAE